jgi:hypothetical protein
MAGTVFAQTGVEHGCARHQHGGAFKLSQSALGVISRRDKRLSKA